MSGCGHKFVVRASLGVLITASLTLSVITLALPALGDTRAVNDASDSGAALDIVGIRHGHAWPPRNDEVTHTIVMEKAWTSDALDTQSLGMCFDLDRDTDVERCLFIKRNQDGSLYGYLEGTTVFRGYARVWRPDEFSVKVRFPLRLLRNEKVTFYRWRAQLHEIHGNNCVETHDCGDVAPNDGFITHRLD